MVPLSEDRLKDLATTLATTLTEETRDYVSAAQIHAEHLHDIPAAARLLCRGSRFADASRLLVLNGHQSLVQEIVDTGLAEAMGSTTDLLADCKAQLNAQVPRIRELRERRANDPLAFYGGDPTMEGAAVDIPDNVSLAPTDASTAAGRTMFTRYTGGTVNSRKTSRTRRKEERKRASGKKGTVYEEEYLVNSVRRLVERVNSTIDEVQSLVEALLRRGMRERAHAVEKALREVLTMCSECRDEVFEVPVQPKQEQPTNEEDANGYPVEEMPRPLGGQGVLWDSVHGVGIGAKGRDAPLVKEFKGLALL